MGGRFNKERFASEAQARKRAKRSRKWKKGDRLPVPYFCEDCHGYHLTSPSDW
jgi:Ni/Co efflux regulator RcnB